MQTRFLTVLLPLLLVFILPLPAFSQASGESTDQSGRLQVFLDCGYCDMNFTREEVNYIDYVRDPKLAQVHVLVTRQSSGSGSRVYDFDFIGKNTFASTSQKLSYTVPPASPRDTERKGLVHTLELGLISYLAQTNMADQIKVRVDQTLAAAPPKVERDPWRNWVFEISGNGNMSKETSRSAFNLYYGLEANRVTKNWRIQTNFYGSYNQQQFNNEEEIISSIRRRTGFYGRAVKSIDNHWSAGLFGSTSSSTYNNMQLSLGLAPALEYSLFPYTEVNRREITFAYRVGNSYRNYLEETIFGKMEEFLWYQAMEINVRLRQPWGSVFSGLEGSHFFHDLSKNKLEFFSRVSLRVYKGLAVDLSGNFDLIRDQLSLAKGETSLEDLLLQQTQLATGYKLSGAIGLSYTFGSMYNNVINTRL